MKRALTNQEIRRILLHNDSSTFVGRRNALALVLILSTGVKISEMTKLRFQHIQLGWKNQKFLCVPSHIAFNGRHRQIALDELVEGCLRKIVELYQASKLSTEPNSPILQSEDGTPLQAGQLAGSLKIMGEKATIPGGNLEGNLRRSFARRLLGRGRDLFEVADQLGVKTLGAVVQNSPVRESEAVKLLLNSCHPLTWPGHKLKTLLRFHFPYWTEEQCEAVTRKFT